jgi:hypothetical protein
MFCVCEDSRVQVTGEELGYFELQSLFKVQIKRDVLPPSIPMKNVRTFVDMCRFFFFPFMGV